MPARSSARPIPRRRAERNHPEREDLRLLGHNPDQDQAAVGVNQAGDAGKTELGREVPLVPSLRRRKRSGMDRRERRRVGGAGPDHPTGAGRRGAVGALTAGGSI